ncbi:hypothetical protein AX774_g6029 [Zancudomyces culisetae]|uniref:Uncharacterized protein n=1 Tax=Zancudomyces culisetae TaxID=1213189 RepID=A0A1R1PHQ9_ZANCU|nr:hypothetical protein AX774_g6029 [Zancudomyces culisetae]|eukprot:OMH80535.1 hypothetical protein AX774_g6029 [Zancudomyces culisetae]
MLLVSSIDMEGFKEDDEELHGLDEVGKVGSGIDEFGEHSDIEEQENKEIDDLLQGLEEENSDSAAKNIKLRTLNTDMDEQIEDGCMKVFSEVQDTGFDHEKEQG